MHRVFTRALSTARRSHRLPTTGAVFDIDGVVLRGEKPLPGAADALRKLESARVPFIFVTNGGGVMEYQKAAQLTEALGLHIHGDQVVCSHSPLRSLVPRYEEEKVLILGSRDSLRVAKEYGFRRAYNSQQLAEDDPNRYPFFEYSHRPLPEQDRGDPFEAVLILHDPIHWAPELQITLDVIRGGSPLGSGSGQAVPVFASNPDFVFSGAYPVPRLACGAFVACLEQLFEQATGGRLHVDEVGKPLGITYDYARRLLGSWRHRQAEEGDALDAPHEESESDQAAHHEAAMASAAGEPVAQNPPFDTIFMVGDNPASDIRGANAAKGPWRSVLVRSGVFGFQRDAMGDPLPNDPDDPADVVVQDIREAVDRILEAHQETLR